MRRAPLPALAAALALALLGALALAGAAGASPAGLARAALGLAGALALAAWAWRARARPGRGRALAPPRLQVLQRVGLSPRAGLALVEVDGRAYLLVHGEGFARLRPVPRSAGGPAPRLTVAR